MGTRHRITALSLALALLAPSVLVAERGPWFLIGRKPSTASSCSVSNSGTRLPTPDSSITDTTCHVWTLGTGTTPAIQILRDGVQVPDSATGAQILWFEGVIYILASDTQWYSWVNTFYFFGPDPETGSTPSPSGTRIPSPDSTITDLGGHIWTLGTGTTPNIQILRDGIQVGGTATGAQILWLNGVIYIKASDGLWYTWIGTFNLFGATDPEGGGPTVGYYVSTSGSDARSCMTALDPTMPKRTIVNALGCLSAGDTLWVRGGNYGEMLHSQAFTMPQGTSWSNKVRIAAYPGETVWLNPSGTDFVMYFGSSYTPQYIEFDGINLDGSGVNYFTFKIEAGSGYNAHHIRLQNAEVLGPLSPQPNSGTAIIAYSLPANDTGGGFNEFINLTVHEGGHNSSIHDDHGFYIATAHNLIEHCNIYHFASSGVQLWNENVASLLQSNGADSNIVRYNLIHDGQTGGYRGWGIITGSGSSGNQIYGNVVYRVNNNGSGSSGISIFSTTGAKVYNNTIYGNVPLGLDITSAAASTTVRNNISYGNSGGDYANAGSGTTASNNLCGSGCNINANPLFANTAASNFRLASTSSPAYNAGFSLSIEFPSLTLDVDGFPFGTFDIGAYEFH